MSGSRTIDFAAVNAAALARLPDLVRTWLPGGRANGREYVARNPLRTDRRLGSFSINMHTGKWGDFATEDRGGDVVSLVAYLKGIRQGEAAQYLADLLGVDHA